MSEKTISKSVADGRQGCDYAEILRVSENIWHAKFRISIHYDSYDFQSRAKIEVWNAARWNEVHHLHWDTLRAPQHAGAESATEEMFKTDRDELLRVARAVLEV